MNRSIFQQHIEFQHGVSALNADDIPTEALTLGEEEESEAVAPAKRSRRFRQADFNPDWHDAKEIVVPFDESSFSGLLVDEKTFQAAYSPKRPPPQAGNLRLETKQTLGKVMSSPDWWDDLMGFCGGLLLFVEILLLVWTAALLLSGFPFSKWLSYTLVCVWTLTLIAFKVVIEKPMTYRLFLWCGTCVMTVTWLVWSPWSHEFTARFSAYFFRM